MKTINNICFKITGIIILVISQVILVQSQDKVAGQQLTYREFIKLVTENNLEFIQEKYNVKIADAEAIAQKILPDPEISFDASEDVYELNLSYDLELGKRKARVRLAKSEAESERLAVEYFFQELRAEATEAFLNVLLQRELLQVKQSSYDYMLQLSRSDSIRYELGEINENDARQSRLEAFTLLNEVFQQQADYQSSLATLNWFMGGRSLEVQEATGNWNTLKMEYNLEELIEIGLNNRIDLLLAEKYIQIAENQLKLIKAERRMDIGLNIGYERDWKGIAPSRDMITGGIAIPLKFSNFNKGEIKASKYIIKQSIVQQKSMELQVRTEISHAFFQFNSSKKQMQQYQTGLLDDAKKILDGIAYRYQRGENDILEVLIAQRTYNEVREQYLETMKEYASSLVELEKACGIWDLEF